MLCSVCQKNKAVICYTEIVNGVKNEKYLCPECAASFDSENTHISPGGLLAGLLTSVLGQASVNIDNEAKKTNLVCPKCGMTYHEFLSRFGCGDCVHTFGFLLDDYLKKIQGNCEHTGKEYSGRETVIVPMIDFSLINETEPVSEEKLLKQQLDAAIRNEEYEEAARLRDLIRNLKKEAASDEAVV